MRRSTIIVIASIIISIIALVLVLRSVPLLAVGSALRQANLFWVLIGVVVIFFTVLTRAVRWRGLLNNRISLRDAIHLMGVTFMLNQLPLRAGEVARSLFVTQRDIPFMTGATSIIVERVLDLLVVVLLIAIAIPFLPDIPQQVMQGAILFGVLGIIGFCVLLFFAHHPQRAHGLLDVVFRLLPVLERLPLATWLDHTLEGLHPLTNWHTLFHALFWTLMAWVTSLLSLTVLLFAFDLETNYWLMSALGVGLTSLSIALPLNVAGIGLFEAAIIFAGSLLGIDTVTATALGFLYHGNAVVGYIILGTIGMLSLGISLGDVLNQQSTSAQSADTTS